MANKYIIEGATYDGDGTTSAEAASNGAAGAWKTLAYFEGTTPAYGALAAGDVVRIRSKTAAGADITRTHAAAISLGSASATADAPITWILDNGTIWSGIDGILTYTTSGAYQKTILANNVVECATPNALVLENTAANPASHSFMSVIGHLIGAKWDNSARTSVSNVCAIGVSGTVERCYFKFGRWAAGANGSCFYTNVASAVRQFINCEYEFAYATPTALQALFGWSNTSMDKIIVVGGRIVPGGGAVSGVCLISGGNYPGSSFRAIGLEFPKAIALSAATPVNQQSIEVIGCDDGLGGFVSTLWGWATSRTDNNPPTLSTRFVDTAATPWAWRVFPVGASASAPVMMPSVNFYSDTAAVRTITQEILVSDTLTFTKDGAWITVEYIDNATGGKKYVSSKVTGSSAELDASTADWTFSTSDTTASWGSVTLDKRKISITTPTSVKPDTQIISTLWTRHKGTDVDDIFFVDPVVSIV